MKIYVDRNICMNGLFMVSKKSDGQIVNVYAVRNDKNGYPHFLIYEDNEWKYVKAKHFSAEV